MSGYRWDPVFRVSAVNGTDYYYWLSDRLSDVGSHTRIGLRYVESMNVREDVNRSLRPVVYGLRPEVDIECIIWSMADQLFLAEIESALMDPLYYNVFLSLDGGVVYRQVVMSAANNAEPISGKTVVGAKFTIRVRCVDLIARRPAMMTDPATGSALIQNGDMEQWASASDAKGWTEVTTGGTVTQETSIVHTAGGSAMKIDRTGAGSNWASQVLNVQISLASWYRIACWFTSGSTGQGRLELQNTRTVKSLTSNGRTWSTPTQYCLDVTVATSYVYGELYFRAASDAKPTDPYLLYAFGYVNPSTIYFDDLSVYGPILRPGVATW